MARLRLRRVGVKEACLSFGVTFVHGEVEGDTRFVYKHLKSTTSWSNPSANRFALTPCVMIMRTVFWTEHC